MEKRTIDRLTVAGLAIFVILSLIYLFRDEIWKMQLDLSSGMSSSKFEVPFAIPSFNMDWFYSMDPATKIIFMFLMTILVATLIGGACILARKRASSKR
jgi:hypothetical protein